MSQRHGRVGSDDRGSIIERSRKDFRRGHRCVDANVAEGVEGGDPDGLVAIRIDLVRAAIRASSGRNPTRAATAAARRPGFAGRTTFNTAATASAARGDLGRQPAQGPDHRDHRVSSRVAPSRSAVAMRLRLSVPRIASKLGTVSRAALPNAASDDAARYSDLRVPAAQRRPERGDRHPPKTPAAGSCRGSPRSPCATSIGLAPWI